MARCTKQVNGVWTVDAGQAATTPTGITGPAIERLALFETMVETITAEQDSLAAELEALRSQGKKNSVKFRELFAKKLTNSSVLALCQVHGLL